MNIFSNRGLIFVRNKNTILKSEVQNGNLFLFVKLWWGCMILLLLYFFLIECVSIENLLNCTLSQQNLVLIDKIRHLFVLFCWLISHIFRIILGVWFKWRLQLSFHHFFPREVFEPYMISKLLSSTPSKPHDWSSLNKFINEICSLNGPSFRNLTLFDGGLLG